MSFLVTKAAQQLSRPSVAFVQNARERPKNGRWESLETGSDTVNLHAAASAI